jgi:hypothetical protein
MHCKTSFISEPASVSLICSVAAQYFQGLIQTFINESLCMETSNSLSAKDQRPPGRERLWVYEKRLNRDSSGDGHAETLPGTRPTQAESGIHDRKCQMNRPLFIIAANGANGKPVTGGTFLSARRVMILGVALNVRRMPH